jgi:hypothetical protein
MLWSLIGAAPCEARAALEKNRLQEPGGCVEARPLQGSRRHYSRMVANFNASFLGLARENLIIPETPAIGRSRWTRNNAAVYLIIFPHE